MDKRINKLGMFNTVVAALVAGVASLCGPAVFAAGEGDKPVVMEDKMAPEPEPKGPLEEFQDSIFGGKVNLNLRLRFEHVNDETGSPGGGRRGQGYAFTERLRLGYGTKPFHGFSAYAEFEDIRAISDNTYDDTTNGNTDEAVIADPADTELNQAFVKYANEWFEFIGDRQRLILDDARFVGNVGWRQNEQTFDAITAKIKPIKDVEVLYSYFFHINRIFGPDADADFDSDSHIVNASYSGLPWGKLTVFAYILDFDNAAANSTNTFGFRFAGSQAINDEWSVGYIGSFARQTDGHDSPLEYEANYFLVEGSVTRKGWGTVGVGYEMLGSDRSRRCTSSTAGPTSSSARPPRA